MNFQVKILLATFVTTVIVSLLAIPILRRLKVGQIEREDGPKSHLKKQGTPTMGGLIIIIAIVIMTIIACIYYSNNPDLKHTIIPLLLVTVGFGVIGLVDDFKKLVLKNTKGLKPAYKMLGLLIISVVYVVYLVQGIGIGTRNIYSDNKNIYRITFMVLCTSCDICNIRNYKCNKSNRWNRWIVDNNMYDYNYMLDSNWNYI